MDADTNHTISHWIANVTSGGLVVSTVLGWAPALAAIVGLIWYLIQIYESTTVQRWMATRRVRKLARLKAQVVMLEHKTHAPFPQPNKPDEPGLPQGYDAN